MIHLLTIAKAGRGELTEKKSRFLGYAQPAANEEEANAFIAKIKAKHWDARHHAYALVIGKNGEYQRSSDDGEPAGTAGRPILEILKNAELTNSVVVVSRYFGGVLLGTGGLVRAYAKAAKLAVNDAGRVRRVKARQISIFADYDLAGKIQNFLLEKGYQIDDIEYLNSAVLRCTVRESEVKDFPALLAQQFQTKIDCLAGTEEHWFNEALD